MAQQPAEKLVSLDLADGLRYPFWKFAFRRGEHQDYGFVVTRLVIDFDGLGQLEYDPDVTATRVFRTSDRGSKTLLNEVV